MKSYTKASTTHPSEEFYAEASTSDLSSSPEELYTEFSAIDLSPPKKKKEEEEEEKEGERKWKLYTEFYTRVFLSNLPPLPEEEIVEYIIRVMYPYGIVCPFCKTKHRIVPEPNRPKNRHCKNCHMSFSTFTGTIAEGSHAKISQWVAAIYSVFTYGNKVSAKYIQEDTEVFYRTARVMLKRIRTDIKRGLSDRMLKAVFGELAEQEEKLMDYAYSKKDPNRHFKVKMYRYYKNEHQDYSPNAY